MKMQAARIILWGNLPIQRSSIPEALADLSSWPRVDKKAMSDTRAAAYDRQVEAIREFVEEPDTSLKEIAKRTGVHREQLYRLLNRCLTTHEDGRIYGYRGAIPHKHLKEYARTDIVRASKPRGKGGAAGAMQQCLRNHPAIARWLAKEAKMRERPLRPGEMREVRKGLRSLHREFLKRLRESHVSPSEWPFNRDEMGLRSFQEYFLSDRAKHPECDEELDSTPGKVGNGRTDDAVEEKPPPALRPFDSVQFDGHKLDLRVTLSFKDQLGLETLVELTRIWILVCLDVVSRAVLGYSIVYAPEYNSDDVARSFQSCFGPHKGPKFTIPGMSIREGGGFPNGVFDQAQFPAWKWFQYDSAKANLAHASLERLTEIIGSFVKSGRLGEPDDRAFMERFFAVLARFGLHRVAGSTGSSPSDLVRELADVGSNLRLLISTDEVEQVVECLLGDYNGEANNGLNGRTPLGVMRYHFEKPGVHYRQLPTTKRRELIFLQSAVIKRVAGKSSPCISFGGEPYTSNVLSSKPGLLGKSLRIYYNIHDIRQLQAFFDDGAELGVLLAPRSWRQTPHSLRQRQEIHRLRRLGKLNYRDGQDAVEAYAAYKRKLAKHHKKAASSLAALNQTAAMAQANLEAQAARPPTDQPEPAPSPPPNPATSAGSPMATASPAAPAAPTSQDSPDPTAPISEGRKPTAPVKPVPLSVRRTFTF